MMRYDWVVRGEAIHLTCPMGEIKLRVEEEWTGDRFVLTIHVDRWNKDSHTWAEWIDDIPNRQMFANRYETIRDAQAQLHLWYELNVLANEVILGG